MCPVLRILRSVLDVKLKLFKGPINNKLCFGKNMRDGLGEMEPLSDV
jgi:hypothetical protein